MSVKMSRLVIAGLITMLVVALTFLGALEKLPTGWRGVAQAAGSAAGVYLGAQLQLKDQAARAEGAARTAVLHILALAKGIQQVASRRNRCAAGRGRVRQRI